jgi:Skp family chaperone for outer membrane proteins
MMVRRSFLAALCFGCLPVLAGAQEQAQPSLGVLVVELERVFSDSKSGQQMTDALRQQHDVFRASVTKIQDELVAEEQSLTDLRASMSHNDFRALADAFDSKVRRIRLESDAKEAAFVTAGENARRQFNASVMPILEELRLERGASAVVERRSIYVMDPSVNITQEVITRLDARTQEPQPAAPVQD